MSNEKTSFIEIVNSSGNVFKDLEIAEPEEYLAKVNLVSQINGLIEQRGLKQIDAANLLGIDQPKISSISRGQLSGFSLERLIGFLNKLDQDVQIVVKPKPMRRKDRGRLRVAFA